VLVRRTGAYRHKKALIIIIIIFIYLFTIIIIIVMIIIMIIIYDNNIFSFNIQTDRPSNDYKHSTKELSQVITGVEFSCTASTQGAHQVVHLILPTSK